MVCAGRYFDDISQRKQFEEIAEKALATFTPSAEALWDSTATLPPALRESHADLFNQLGEYFHNANDWNNALKYFAKAWKINPNKKYILTSALDSLNRLHRPKQGLALIYSVKNKEIAKSPNVEAWKAWFLYKTGAFKDSARVYGELFKKGYRGDTDFRAYVKSLARLKRWSDIRDTAQEYDSTGNGFDAAVNAAVVLMDNNQAKEALEVMRSMHRHRVFNADLAYKEMRALRDLERHKELLSLCEEMSEKGINSAALHFYMGEALYGLGKKQDALESYKTALRMAPDNKVIMNRIIRLEKSAERKDEQNTKE